MEVIIQIIVVLIIIASVVKRFKEIGGKTKDLTKEQEKTVLPEQLFETPGTSKPHEMAERMPSQEFRPGIPVSESVQPVTPPPLPGEDFFKTYPEPMISEVREPVMRQPVERGIEALKLEIPVSELHKPEETTVPGIVTPAVRPVYKKAHVEPLKGLKLGFNATQVTRGIIMSEILGPPVSLRVGERV